MFARTVSVVLIAAIIACPMWCGNGVCHATECCLAEQPSCEACPVHGTARCCDQPSPENNRHCPSESPGTSSCQGVCGGAVFTKPNKLNDVADSFFGPLMDIDSPVVARLVECNFHGIEHDWHNGGGNHGRSLRTLHMSFLC